MFLDLLEAASSTFSTSAQLLFLDLSQTLFNMFSTLRPLICQSTFACDRVTNIVELRDH